MPTNLIKNPQIKELRLTNFRNLKQAQCSFGPNINLIMGNNAAGKTNLLESIALACSLRNMNSFNNTDLIHQGQESALISAKFINSFYEKTSIHIFHQGKKATLNDKPLKSVLQLAQNFSLVYFIPAELNMISGTASLRRKALDQACASLFSVHLQSLKNYEKILSQRNQLLKDYPQDQKMIETFSFMLVQEATTLIHNRLKTIHALKPFFVEKMNEILGDKKYDLLYKINDDYIENILPQDILLMLNEERKAVEAKEKIRKVTLFGPHLHDMEFFIDNLTAQKICSRGQSRVLVLAFKIAQMKAINEIRKALPIVLLDDIVSELDSLVRKNLINCVVSLGAQVFFSATDSSDFLSNDVNTAFFMVKNGEFFDK